MRCIRFSFAIASLIAFLCLAESGFAATFTVTNTNDTGPGSLRQAIDDANTAASDDVIEFDPTVFRSSQSIFLASGALSIANNGSLQINGTGADLLGLIGNQSSVVSTEFNAVVTINGVTITNGSPVNTEGGGIFNRGILTINNAVVKHNFATFGGGGIYSTGTLTVNNCTITENRGAGIQQESGISTTVNNSLITRNSSPGISTARPLFVNNSTVSENRAGGIGSFNGNITLTNSTVSGNYGRTTGAGIIIRDAVLNMINSTVAFNRGDASNGGGISVEGSATATARNTIIARNTGNSTPSDFQGTLNSQGYNLIGSTVFMTIIGNTTGNLLNVDPNLLPLANYGGPTPTHALHQNSPAIDAADPADIPATDQRGITRPFDGNDDGIALADIGATEAGILVTNTNDSGAGSLRQAIIDANSTPANDEIRFSTLFDTAQTIALTSGELNVGAGGSLVINGTGAETLAISGNNLSRVLFVRSGANLTVRKLRISSGRTMIGAGGGISSQAGSTVTVADTTLSGNAAAGGGALFNSGSMIIENSVIDMNTSLDNTGGGIWNFNGTLIVKRSRLTGNNAVDGGAIDNLGTLTLGESIVSGNSCSNEGGGIRHFFGDANILNSLIAGNTAGDVGGGIFSRGNTLSISDTTISGNTSTGDVGGGILILLGTVNLTNVTVAFNSATSGGGLSIGSAIANLRSTIVAKNVVSGSNPDVGGTINSLGYNLIGNTAGITITGDATGNQLNVDPLLLPLAENGGFSKTHALQLNSPAIDAGDPIQRSSLDQRRHNRAADGNADGTPRSDIGAYELGTVIANVSDSGPGSLRQAILDARRSIGSDELVLSSLFDTPQTIVLTSGELSIGAGGALTINGAGNLTISGNNQSRIFNIVPFGELTLIGVTVTNGRVLNGDGGAIISLGTLTLNDSTVAASTANGGGSTPRGGGGIYNNGGILCANSSVIHNNILTSGMGSGILTNRGTTELVNSTLRNNSGGTQGGGIANFIGDVRLFESTVTSNTTNEGGGIWSIGTLALERSLVDGNTAQQYGGMYNGGVLTAIDSTISNNRANTGQGGGLFNFGAATLIGSTISGNSSAEGGGINYNGGINNDRGPLKIVNSTISNNRSTGTGGGMTAVAGSVSLTNSTIAFNSAANAAGGVRSVNSNITARNSLVARNSANGLPSDFFGTIVSAGYNLIGTTAGTTITGDTTGNLVNLDPLLDPVLRNAYGLTKTHALRRTSPAIDAGASSTAGPTDQRGRPRPYDFATIPNAPGGNGSDIGAFERQEDDVSGSPVFDFDGDGKTDLGIFRPSVGEWWYQRSSDGLVPAFQFGAGTDRIVPADYTGDGKTDIAFFRPSTGEWYILRSENLSFYSFPFGTSEDIPAPADYDNDGKADPAVFRPSSATWFIQRSSDNQTTIAQFGATGDHPVAADYDGDGKADLAIYRPSNGQWWLNRSTAGVIVHQFGDSNDKPVQGDYTGDGKSDVAFWRPSTGEWYILRSEDNSYYSAPFGTSTDIPAPGDYDGDGKFDTTVFRPSNATWFIQRTTAGTLIQQFGATGDMPIPNAFVR